MGKKLIFTLVLALSMIFWRQSGTCMPLKVYYIERPPYYFTDHGRAAGFIVELSRKIFTDAGIDTTFESMPPKRIILEMKTSGGFACSIGWFKKPVREKFAKFSLPIYKNKPIVALAKKEKIEMFKGHKTLEDLFRDNSLVMGRIASFSYGTFVDRLGEKLSPRKFEIAGKQKQLIQMIFLDRISYMLVAPEEINSLIKSAELEKEDFISLSLHDVPGGNLRYIMFSREVDDNIIEKINRSIERLVKPRSFDNDR